MEPYKNHVIARIALFEVRAIQGFPVFLLFCAKNILRYIHSTVLRHPSHEITINLEAHSDLGIG